MCKRHAQCFLRVKTKWTRYFRVFRVFTTLALRRRFPAWSTVSILPGAWISEEQSQARRLKHLLLSSEEWDKDWLASTELAAMNATNSNKRQQGTLVTVLDWHLGVCRRESRAPPPVLFLAAPLICSDVLIA